MRDVMRLVKVSTFDVGLSDDWILDTLDKLWALSKD